MTTTDLLVSQSLGTAAGDVQPTKKTAVAFTYAYALSLQLVLPASLVPELRNGFLFCHTSSPFDVTVSAAPSLFRNTCMKHHIDPPSRGASADFIFNLPLFDALGGFFYTWFELPAMSAAMTANLKLFEHHEQPVV